MLKNPVKQKKTPKSSAQYVVEYTIPILNREIFFKFVQLSLNPYLRLFATVRESFTEGRTGGLCHGSRVEKLTNHESRIFKFCFEALHVSREICASRTTENIFLKSRFTVNEMI